MSGLKSDSTHHFFRNACTKSGSLQLFLEHIARRGYANAITGRSKIIHPDVTMENKGNNKITELRTILQSHT
jgi:hypothetical protein